MDLALTRTMERVASILASAGYPSLTADQVKIITDIIVKVNEEGKPLEASLKGPAGTGKTMLLVGLIIALDAMKYKVVVTSFTHKACSVIATHMQTLEQHLRHNIVPLTLHSLLNLKPARAEYGKPETFTQTRAPELDAVDFVIVDECSMVGADLTTHIQAGIVEQGIPILYAGDPAQLMPVNEKSLSTTFKTPTKYKLTEILRHDGAILNLATKIRTLPYLPQVAAASGGGTDVIVYKNDDALVAAWLNSLLDSDKGNDSTVMLTYMNKHRREFNRQARVALKGADPPRFIEGDVLLALSPIIQEEKLIYSNNEDVHIIAPPVLIEDYTPVDTLDFTCAAWQIRSDKGALLYVLADQEAIDKYAKYLKALGMEIAKEGKAAKSGTHHDSRAVKRRWASQYFPLKASFADLDFRYSLTVHKSQGSTFKYVYVNSDYRKARDQQKQLMYVAVTRASREVHHLDTTVS